MDWFHAVRQDENQALREVYRLYRTSSLNWLRRKFRLQMQDAEDVFESAILILYHNTVTAKLTELPGGPQPYLYGIMKNKAQEVGRLHSRMVYPENLLEDLTQIPESVPEEESDQVHLVKQYLPQLSDSCRKILDLYYYKELNMSEIAEDQAYSGADSVKTQKYKCLKRLQSMIEEHIRSKGKPK